MPKSKKPKPDPKKSQLAASASGHGNSPREAAIDLADQLREIARLVEAQEGIKSR